MRDVTFRQVEEALRLRPSIFSERQRDVLSRLYGLSGDSPANFSALAKEYGVAKARMRQIVERSIELVQQVFAPAPQIEPVPHRLPVDDEIVSRFLRNRLRSAGLDHLEQVANQRPDDLKRAKIRSAKELAEVRELLAKHGLHLFGEDAKNTTKQGDLR